MLSFRWQRRASLRRQGSAMLPDLRAVIAAIIATLGVVMVAFGVTATIRVAQDDAKSPLEAAKARPRAEIARSDAVPIIAVPERVPRPAPSLAATSLPAAPATSPPATSAA